MRTPKNVYRRFIEFEERAADIYLKLASRFSEDRGLCSLWLDMAMHEKQHAGLLQFCLGEGCFGSNLPNDAEIRKISGLFRSLEKRAADPKLDITGAFALSAEMEGSEVNEIYCRLTETVHSSMYLLRRKIAASVPSHIARLAGEGQKFGVSRKILKKLDGLKEKCPGA
jgi:hypothetical protein